jgi:hypothetical protein
MAESEALTKALRFADTAYTAAIEDKSREHQDKLRDLRAQAAVRGILQSGTMVAEEARLRAELITKLLEARLSAILEGLELNGVAVDEGLAARILTDVQAKRSALLQHCNRSSVTGLSIGGPDYFRSLVESGITLTPNHIRIQVERRRLVPRNTDGQTTVTNVYHIYGHNPRVGNADTNDHSINVVTISQDQIFARLKQEITAALSAGDERKEILDKLAALEQVADSPSFSQRYAEFINAAANHMTILGPFIPALTEMLLKAIS